MTLGNDSGSTRGDDFLARVYQQVIGVQAEQYAAAYDAGAGLARFTGWLQDNAAAEPGLDADQAVAQLYALHYQSLVRLAMLLVRDTATAEDVVQDAFVAIHHAWPRLGDAEKARAYLRQAVVNRSRSVLRHRSVTGDNPPQLPAGIPGPEHGTLVLLELDAALAALRGLPERQREAVVLRYYAGLSETEIAGVMGITRAAVQSHTARGLSVLRAAIEQATSPPDCSEDSGHGPSNP